MAWTGFSDVELERIQNSKGPGGSPEDRSAYGPDVRPKTNRRPTQLEQGKSALNKSAYRGRHRETVKSYRASSDHEIRGTNITHEQMLSSPKSDIVNSVIPNAKLPTVSDKATSEYNMKVSSNEPQNESSSSSSAAETNSSSTEIQCKEQSAMEELDPEQVVQRELSNLQKFQEQQKNIEELNKKKKKMLAEAIQERQKWAKAETTKLSQIQKELARLDQLCTADVTIIRNKIEEASREYLEAQKKYEKAEREFVAAKIDLHNKSDMKEQLTEHLYTIIHQNEMRKAEKLAILMEKLEMVTQAEVVDVSACSLSPIVLLNECQQAQIEARTRTTSVTTPDEQLPVNDTSGILSTSLTTSGERKSPDTTNQAEVKPAADQATQVIDHNKPNELELNNKPSDAAVTNIKTEMQNNNNIPVEKAAERLGNSQIDSEQRTNPKMEADTKVTSENVT